ncbi:MAG: tRNA 2-thiouridine(34) synthase MnmA [Rickettsiales bacterium]|jgi:tRNA-specific 2-thiouridylase|nr:tRNA 2-thiouridine(34) synthase MnmA [Rickettsiales bacterium]
MSGGVDSSVTAARLQEDGHSPIGVTLKMGRKCDQLAIDDAKKVADLLAIEHIVLDVSADFEEKVVKYFVDSYVAGETPNPCGMCNRYIKFQELIGLMQRIGADYLATGHYAAIVENNGVHELRKAKDVNKDQSYFLSTIKYDFLKHIKFPLNSLEKSEVRKYAKKIGLHVADKQESQDICFIETNSYKDFLMQRIGSGQKCGLIRHTNGEILGEHSGTFRYTIGQRRGLGISYRTPIFVIRIDASTNTVYLGDEKELYSDEVNIININCLASSIDKNKEYSVKLRSSHREQRGTIELEENGRARVKLLQPTRAVTRGQLCCLYDGDRVICSGWIV